MKANTYGPFRSFQGTYKTTDLVFFESNGQFFARARVKGTNPRSQDQVLVRTFMDLATKNWDTLSAAQRQGWQAYAEKYFDHDEQNNPVKASGISTYVRANSVRQLLGLSLTSAPPAEAPPSPLTSIAQIEGSLPDTLGLTLTHGLPTLVGYQVLVRMTPAMATVARTPLATDYRYVRGVNPNSAAALPASGATVEFTPTRFLINDGQRYGVTVRVVRTADGIMSLPRVGDFIKVV